MCGRCSRVGQMTMKASLGRMNDLQPSRNDKKLFVCITYSSDREKSGEWRDTTCLYETELEKWMRRKTYPVIKVEHAKWKMRLICDLPHIHHNRQPWRSETLTRGEERVYHEEGYLPFNQNRSIEEMRPACELHYCCHHHEPLEESKNHERSCIKCLWRLQGSKRVMICSLARALYSAAVCHGGRM